MNYEKELLLNDELKKRYRELGKLEVGTEEYEKAVNAIAKLENLALEMDKLKHEQQQRDKDREIDTELKKEQMLEARRDQRNKLIQDSVIKGVSLAATVWGAVYFAYFEKEGNTMPSLFGKMFWNKLGPRN